MVNVNEKHLNLAKQVRCLHLWEENDAIEHNAKLFADFESEVRLNEKCNCLLADDLKPRPPKEPAQKASDAS